MGVEFNERPQINYSSQPAKSGVVTNLLIKTGFAKDENSAKIIMVVIIVICFALSIYIFTKAF